MAEAPDWMGEESSQMTRRRIKEAEYHLQRACKDFRKSEDYMHTLKQNLFERKQMLEYENKIYMKLEKKINAASILQGHFSMENIVRGLQIEVAQQQLQEQLDKQDWNCELAERRVNAL